MKSLFRNITYFIQCALPTMIMPPIVLISIITAGNVKTIDLNASPVTNALFGILVIQFFMIMNEISATAISRDGEAEIGFMKTIPVSIAKQLSAKVMPSFFVGLFSLLMAMIFNIIIFSFSIIESVVLTIIGVILNYVQSYLFLIIDLKKPKLGALSEIAVVKHNLNVLKAIGIWLGIIIVTSILGNIFVLLNINYFEFVFLFLCSAIFFVLKKYVEKNAEKLFEKIF